MMRWLLLILFIYVIYRLIQGPKNRRRSTIRFRFGDFKNNSNNQNRSGSRQQKLDEIEDAEFEDITDKVKKDDNS